jgi:hypothetical protein
VYDSETVQALPLFHFISAHAAGLKIETIEVVLQSDWNEIKKYVFRARCCRKAFGNVLEKQKIYFLLMIDPFKNVGI